MKKHTSLIAVTTLLASLALVAFTGCNSSTVESSWTAPGTQKLSFKKVLIVMINPDGATRRLAEDAIRAQMPNVDAVQSYTLFPDNQAMKNGAVVRGVLTSQGFDSAIVVRLVSKDTEITSMGGPGPIGPYGSFWGAWGAAGWGGAWGGDIQTDTIVGMETNVYEMSGDKIVYSAVTKTTDPENIKDLVNSAAQAVRTQLEKQGLIPQTK